MRLLFVLLISLLGVSASSKAQNGTISGIITSQGKAMEFVAVVIKGTSLGSISNEKGYFRIEKVPFGRHQVLVSSLGYASQSEWITISDKNPHAESAFTLFELSATLEEVVVSGTMKEVSRLESAVPVEVYTPLFFRANPTPSVFESLQNVNGVRPQINCNVCNTGDIHINGLEGPYTMILIDGMPIVSGLSTIYGLTGIPQALIERMEIVKGPASTLYGSEAVGGLINVITKSPEQSPLISVDAMATSWGEINTDLGFKMQIGKKAQSLMGINYFNYQHPIDNNGDGFTDVTLQNRFSIFNKWSFKKKYDRHFTLAARYNHEDRWGGQMQWTKEHRGGDVYYGESIYTDRWEIFGTYPLPFKESLNLQFSANGHRQDSFYGTTSFNADQYVSFGQLTWNKNVNARHDLLLGLAYRYTYYDDNTPATAQVNSENKTAATHLPGLFLQDEIILNPQNKLLLGMRYDYNHLHGNIFSPRINYKWSSQNKQNVIRLSAGNGYRVANIFTEDHAALTGARTVVFTEKLLPETSWNVNLNLVKKIFSDGGHYIGLDGSLFYTFFNNRIVPDYESHPNQIIYGNLEGSAISKGFSLNLDMAFSKGLKILAGGTLMDVSLSENGISRRQLLTERFSGVWNVGYTFGNSGFSADYTGNVYAPMRLPLLGDLDNRARYSPWWSIQNLQLTKVFDKGWAIYGGLKNLLNYTPPSNSIARAFDPFDKNVVFDANGQVVATPDNPQGLSFDPSYVFAPNQGIRGFIGFRYSLSK